MLMQNHARALLIKSDQRSVACRRAPRSIVCRRHDCRAASLAEEHIAASAEGRLLSRGQSFFAAVAEGALPPHTTCSSISSSD